MTSRSRWCGSTGATELQMTFRLRLRCRHRQHGTRLDHVGTSRRSHRERAARLPFKAVYLFRPSVIQPMHGARSKTRVYAVTYMLAGWMLPPLRALFPRRILTTESVGQAMLAVARRGAAGRAGTWRYLRRRARRRLGRQRQAGRSLSQTILMMRHCPASRTSVKKLTPRPRRLSCGDCQVNS